MYDNETLPKLLQDNSHKYGEKEIAFRKKELGIWHEYTWQDYYEATKYFCLGLIQIGFKKGDVVAIVGDTDPEWFIAELAAQAGGGKSVGLFGDGLPSELEYIIVHSDATVVVAKDQEQVDKIIQIKERIDGLKKIIYWDDKGIWNYDEPLLTSFDRVMELGKKSEKPGQYLFEKMVEKGKGDDVAILAYTSGTTGKPKGVMLSHQNLLHYAKALRKMNEPLKGKDYVAYGSPAWVFEQWVGLSAGLFFPMVINFCEDPETVIPDIREISPYFLMLAPRQLESLARTVQVKIRDTSWWKRMLFNWGMGVGYKVSGVRENGKKLSRGLSIYHSLADVLVLRAIRDRLGLSRSEFLLTGSASMSPDVYRFFHAIGREIRVIYGGTEPNVASATRAHDFAFDTVGTILPGIELKFSEKGEILVRGKHIFKGYHKDIDATKERIDDDGWFHTGDAGIVNDKGQLIFWDRVNELMKLAGGEKFSPQYEETRLRFSPYIEDSFVIGDKKKGYVTCIISIDFSNVAKWAEERNLAFTTFVDLSQKREVLELIKEEVEKVNQRLPEFAKITKFINLHKSFDADDAELTRTRKIIRATMSRRYGGIIDAMYEGKETFSVDATVVYRDGRKGTVNANLVINTL